MWMHCLTYIFCLNGLTMSTDTDARRGGVEVAGWTWDRTIRVRFPAYPHRVWALWWQGGKRRLRTSWCPCRGRLGTLKTPSYPWRWVPGSRTKFGNWTSVPSLYSWNIAECDVKPQSTNQLTDTDFTFSCHQTHTCEPCECGLGLYFHRHLTFVLRIFDKKSSFEQLDWWKSWF